SRVGISHRLLKLSRYLSTQFTALFIVIRELWRVPNLSGVAPHWASDLVGRLGGVPGMHMAVHVRPRVAEHLVVDPPHTVLPPRVEHCVSEDREIEEERSSVE